MIQLYGLRIACDTEPLPEPGPDIHWTRERCDWLDARPTGSVFHVERADGLWTHHSYGLSEATALEFAISPGGWRVISRAIPDVADEDVLGLFAEAVMRTIFHRMRLVSFHGAALSREGEAILLLGPKGAGKSTLAAALLAQGWTLLTDDLALVRKADDCWRVPAGFRQLKLHENSALHFGYDPSTLSGRWRSVLHAPDPVHDKLIVKGGEAALADARLRAIYILRPRAAGGAEIQIDRPPHWQGVRLLVENLTHDPLQPGASPSRDAMVTIGALLEDIDVLGLRLPDALSELGGVGSLL